MDQKTASSSVTVKPAVERTAVIGVIGLYGILSLLAANRIVPWSDEGGLANAAYNLAFRGFMGTTVFDEQATGLQGIHEHTYYLMPLGMVLQAAAFRLFGFGLVTMRMLSLGMGLVHAGAWNSIVRRLTGNRWLGYGTALILLTDYLFVMGSSSGRVDMICAGFGSAGLALFLKYREKNFLRALLLGNLFVAASGMTHPLGILYLAGLALLVFLMDRGSMRAWKPWAVAAAPYAVGGVLWGAYILQTPQDFMQQFIFCVTAGGRMSAWSSPLQALSSEFTDRYLRAFGMRGHNEGSSGPIMLKGLLLLVYILGVGTAVSVRAIRSRTSTRRLFMLTAMFFLLLTFIEGQRLNVYLVHILPLYAALLAISGFWLWENHSRAVRTLVLLVMGGFLALQTGGILLKIYQGNSAAYREATSFARQQAGQERIAGGSQLGFGVGFDRNLVDDNSLGFYSGQEPDWVLVDSHYRDAFEVLRATNSLVYQHITETLPQYEKVYDEDGYQLYQRN